MRGKTRLQLWYGQCNVKLSWDDVWMGWCVVFVLETMRSGAVVAEIAVEGVGAVGLVIADVVVFGIDVRVVLKIVAIEVTVAMSVVRDVDVIVVCSFGRRELKYWSLRPGIMYGMVA